MIPLHIWAKQQGIGYSQARKLYNEGKLAGAIETKNIQNKPAVYVPDDLKYEYSSVTKCQICGRSFVQITSTHLMKAHQMTLQEYKTRFPEASIVSSDLAATISAVHAGRPKSEETKRRISEGRSGVVPKNHPRFVKGAYTPSAETLAKMSASHLGKTHTEESKRKIGDGNRGKIMPREDVERRRLEQIERYKRDGHTHLGRVWGDEFRAIMRKVAVKREAGYSPERKALIAERKSKANTGLKRTDEQRERYRHSRTKWMSENWQKIAPTAGERDIAEWLQLHRINFVCHFYIEGFPHPYDFFLPDHNTLIEFDGAHHWWRPWFKAAGKTIEEKREIIRKTMEKDAMESLFAGLSGYRIIRVRGVARCGDAAGYGSLEDQLELQGFDMP